MAASAVELAHANWRVLRVLAGDKTARRAKPLRVPRPGDVKKTVTRNPAEIRRFLAATTGRG